MRSFVFSHSSPSVQQYESVPRRLLQVFIFINVSTIESWRGMQMLGMDRTVWMQLIYGHAIREESHLPEDKFLS